MVGWSLMEIASRSLFALEPAVAAVIAQAVRC